MVICCIGDSLTEGDYGIKGKTGIANIHPENYPHFLSKLTGAEVRNFGKCGWRSSHMLEWYQKGGLDLKGASLILIMLGTNGGQNSSGSSPENSAYLKLIHSIQTDVPGAVLMLLTPPHATEDPSFSNCGYMPQILEAQKFTRQTALSLDLPLIDLALSPRITSETEAKLQSNDGLHFNEDGYRILAEEVLSGIRKNGFII